MKYQQSILLILLSLLTFSCVDDLTDFGSGVRPSTDGITIGADTFHLKSKTFLVDSILSVPDSFLLGTYKNQKYGTVKSDVLAELNYPENFRFPAGAQADSLLLVFYYTSWFGDPLTPIEVTVHEMNKTGFSYTAPYYSNISPENYVDLKAANIGQKSFTIKDASYKRVDTTSIQMKLDTALVRKFFNRIKEKGTTNFSDFFRGIYVTTTLGKASIINVEQMDVELYYHYKYYNTAGDSLVTVSQYVSFPANKEVRQVNRIAYDKQERQEKLNALPDNMNYVVAPANMNTQVTIPLNAVQKRMDSDPVYQQNKSKRQLLNSAILKLDVVEDDSLTDTTLYVSKPSYLLLVKSHYKDKVFSDRYIPSSKDTIALLGSLSYTYNDSTKKYNYYYSYNLAPMISQELKTAKANNVTEVPDLNLTLIPVSIEATTSSSTYTTTVTAIKPLSGMAAATLRSAKVMTPSSGKTVTEPMHLKLVYSLF